MVRTSELGGKRGRRGRSSLFTQLHSPFLPPFRPTLHREMHRSLVSRSATLGRTLSRTSTSFPPSTAALPRPSALRRLLPTRQLSSSPSLWTTTSKEQSSSTPQGEYESVCITTVLTLIRDFLCFTASTSSPKEGVESELEPELESVPLPSSSESGRALSPSKVTCCVSRAYSFPSILAIPQLLLHQKPSDLRRWATSSRRSARRFEVRPLSLLLIHSE